MNTHPHTLSKQNLTKIQIFILFYFLLSITKTQKKQFFLLLPSVKKKRFEKELKNGAFFS